MKKVMISSYFNRVFFLFCLSILTNCANRGRPSGGPKDETPPEIIKSSPENFNLNFDSDEITIQFNEFIKIKNLEKNLIISPPMDPKPTIIPLGSASKSMTIKINDTLLPNTTYSLNFGESIVDNNEENPYPFYKYVFSTGDYIDSLKIKGTVKDALNRKPDEFISVFLYERDSSFTDSIIYKEKPRYVTSTLDTTNTFNLSNLKEGTYLLVALKDENGNYTFEPKSDKVGFIEKSIEIPGDSIFDITLFKEELDFKPLRASFIAGQKIAFGYEGNADKMKIELLSEVKNHKTRVTKDAEKDSLYYWYKPKIEADSLLFRVSQKKVSDTVTVRMRNLEKDSLVIKAIQSNTLLFTEDFEIEGTIPFSKIDTTKVELIDTDSLKVPYAYSFDKLENRYKFIFDKKENTNYNFTFYPGAVTDFFDNKNDTLSYKVRTKEYSDYGNIRVQLVNAKFPIILQLVTTKEEVYRELYVTENKPIDFVHLESGTYFIRAIFDENKNGKYDPGNYLLKRKPERVSYSSEPQEVRSNFDFIVTFTLED